MTGWSWSFGDGGTETVKNPSHTYTAGGTYTVTLRATDDDGATNDTSAPVTVTAPSSNLTPRAAFVALCNGLTCRFNDQTRRSGWHPCVLEMDVRERHQLERAESEQDLRERGHLHGDAGGH